MGHNGTLQLIKLTFLTFIYIFCYILLSEKSKGELLFHMP